jgi:foldase protein PrsA
MTERAKLFSAETGSTQTTLVLPTSADGAINEAILLKFASEKGVEATDEDIKTEQAKLLGITVDDPNFDTLLQQEIDTVGLTEEQYNDYVRGRVLDDKMTAKFTEELPAGVESVHYRQIQVADQAAADDMIAQLEGGADFADLAKQNSTDTTSKDSGGDKGWVPRGVLTEAQEDILFGLEPGENAIYPSAGGQVFVYQAIERSDNQPIDESWKQTLAAKNYADWKDEKKESVTIVNHLDPTEGDADKIKYIIDHADLVTSQ